MKFILIYMPIREYYHVICNIPLKKQKVSEVNVYVPIWINTSGTSLYQSHTLPQKK